MSIKILAIESSCDDTSAAVSSDTLILSNIIANQDVHKKYGGVVPEFASRAHQQHIIPVVYTALSTAKIHKNQLDAIAYTRGPGLLGSLLVGSSFAKTLALALDIPLIEVDHLKAHILAHFAEEEEMEIPEFPFLCLLVSGGHSMIVKMLSHTQMEVLGQSIDDAAGEAFDKAAKIMGLAYPGGPEIDRLAKKGNPKAFRFSKANIKDLNFSFSGLKTSFLYFLRDELKKNPDFIEANKADLAASIQDAIVSSLLEKISIAVEQTGIRRVAIAGGVSANSYLREQLHETAKKIRAKVYVPKFKLSTDNAAMIAIAAYYKYLDKDFSTQDAIPYSRSFYK